MPFVIVKLPNGKYLGHDHTEVDRDHARLIDLSTYPHGAVLPGTPETVLEQTRDRDAAQDRRADRSPL